MINMITGNEQYLTFLLKGEVFAFDVLKTREVLKLVKITPIPRTPSFLAGVINLRGSVVPVVNLRAKFDMPDIQPDRETSIIIVEVAYGRELVVIGALVDAVKAVVRIEKDRMDIPPRIGMKLNANMISAIAKNDDYFVLILNVDMVFSGEELNELVHTANGSREQQTLASA